MDLTAARITALEFREKPIDQFWGWVHEGKNRGKKVKAGAGGRTFLVSEGLEGLVDGKTTL